MRKHRGYTCARCGSSFTSNYQSMRDIKRKLKRIGWKFRLFRKPICDICHAGGVTNVTSTGT